MLRTSDDDFRFNVVEFKRVVGHLDFTGGGMFKLIDLDLNLVTSSQLKFVLKKSAGRKPAEPPSHPPGASKV